MTEPELPETDSGDGRRVSRRMCAVAREALPVDALIRFVAGPEGEVVPDLKQRLPGRGVWIGGTRVRVAEAVRRNVFAKALKAPLKPGADLPDRVADLLRADALQMLAMANKAGAVVAGFERIADSRRPWLVLLQARDGSAAECARLADRLRGQGPGGGDPALIRRYDAAELALSLGRQHVIHAALRVQDVARAFLARAHRLEEFEAGGPAES